MRFYANTRRTKGVTEIVGKDFGILCGKCKEMVFIRKQEKGGDNEQRKNNLRRSGQGVSSGTLQWRVRPSGTTRPSSWEVGRSNQEGS